MRAGPRAGAVSLRFLSVSSVSTSLRHRSRAVPSETKLILAITALAAVARFVALGTQSYWYDEGLTVLHTRLSFADMFTALKTQESTPPLYFVLSWVWARVFGDGEVALRSLSAIAGTLTIPVAYLAARSVIGRRGALMVGLLAALSPALIWYSQEARSYAVLLLLCALSLMFFLRSRSAATRRNLIGWSVASALALTAHYFALFLVAPEAVWLLAVTVNRRAVVAALLPIAVAGAALAPLALYQRAHTGTEWISRIPFGGRAQETVYFFSFGRGLGVLRSHERLALLVVGAVFVLAIAAVMRGPDPRARRGALVALGVGVAVIAIPVAARVVHNDFFLDRNVLAAWLPLIIVLAAATAYGGHAKIGLAVVIGICTLFAAIDIRTPGNVDVQRDDWRAVARVLGPARSDRAIVVAPGWQVATLSLYAQLGPLPATVPVSEVDTVVYHGLQVYADRVFAPSPGPAFKRVATVETQRMTVTRYMAAEPTPVDTDRVVGQGHNRSEVFALGGTRDP